MAFIYINSCLGNGDEEMEVVAVDLFCGIGGLTHGIEKSGIKVAAGIDIDSTCKYAYESNNSAKFINKGVEELTGTEVKSLFPKDSIKVLVGCAPCQPFSNYSLRYNKDGKKKDDKWKLLYFFADIIEKIVPDIISMENVPQLAKQTVFNDFVEKLESLGYSINWEIVNCAHYKVPQNRRRLVLLASKFGDIAMKAEELGTDDVVTVRDAIADLPNIADGEAYLYDNMHKASKLTETNRKRIQQSIPGGTWKEWDEELVLPCHKKESGKGYSSVYGRMEWDKLAPTITTQFYGYGNGRFGHPEQDRGISFREGAILQSFPKNYKFFNKYNPQTYKQLGVHIGNAVPVELGRAIGESIKIHLNKYNKG